MDYLIWPHRLYRYMSCTSTADGGAAGSLPVSLTSDMAGIMICQTTLPRARQVLARLLLFQITSPITVVHRYISIISVVAKLALHAHPRFHCYCPHTLHLLKLHESWTSAASLEESYSEVDALHPVYWQSLQHLRAGIR